MPRSSDGRTDRRVFPTLDPDATGFRSKSFTEVRRIIRLIAKHTHTLILLVGESGTGKTRLARWIHNISPRADKQFIDKHLAAIDDSLVSAELFGYVQGAFTGATGKRNGAFVTADGGTLFLDEIGKASLVVQTGVLKAIDEQEITPLGADRSIRVNTRIIAATNVPLDELVESGRFLPDLRARLAAFTVVLPPLRERAEDIPALIEHYLSVYSAACGYTKPPKVSDEAKELLCASEWRDNLRGLSNVIHNAIVMADGKPLITPDELPREFVASVCGARRWKPSQTDLLAALEKTGNKSKAARNLDISRSTVYRRLERMRNEG
jgi:Nif-specific regulatory protein